jgi:hypothetical protein
MTEPSVLDFLNRRLRFWRPPPAGTPTLRQLWSEGTDQAETITERPTADDDSPRRRPRVAVGTGPFPLGVLSAFVMALIGQRLLVDGQPAVAAVLLAGAVGAVFFAVRRDEIRVPRAREAAPGDDAEPRPRVLFGLAGLIFAIATAVLAGGNRAGVLLGLAWIAAVVCTVIALGPRPSEVIGRWRSARAGRRGEPNRPLFSWQTAVLSGLMILAVVVRTDGLAAVPAEMISVHAELLQAVHAVSQPDPPIVFPSSVGGFRPLPVVVVALLAPFAGGLGFTALKLGTVLAGLLTVPLIYLLGREVGDGTIGLCGAALAAVGHWPDLVSRLGFTAGWQPLAAATVMLLVLRAIRLRRRAAFVGAGLAVGLSLHTHAMAPSIAATAAALVGLAMIPADAAGRRRLAVGLAVMLMVAAVVGLPTLVAAPEPLPQNGPLWWLGAAAGDRSATVSEGLFDRAVAALLLPVWSDGPAWFHGGGDRAGLDVTAAALLMLGAALIIVLAVADRRFDGVLLSAAVPLLMLPAIIAPLPPVIAVSPLRCGGALAPVFVIAGLGLAALLRSLSSAFAVPVGRWLAVATAVLVIAASATAGRAVIRGSFAATWDESTWNASEIGEVVRGALSLGVPADRVHVIPFPHWVDTRLVAVEAGLPGRDLGLDARRLAETAQRGGPQLFILHPSDRDSRRLLGRELPATSPTTHPSRLQGKSFVSIMDLSVADGG